MASDRRKGLLVLLLILTGGIIWFQFTPKQKDTKILSFVPPKSKDSLVVNRLEQIDLNTCTAEELDALPGIGEKISQRIIDYREKSGGFQNIEAVKAIPGLEKIWDQVVPYFRIENRITTSPAQKIETGSTNGQPLQDLNQISETDLQAMNILPEDLAHRLIRYRDACKGFKSFDHVARTHGLSSLFLDRLKQHFYVKTTSSKRSIQPIDINRADSAQLEALPGIGEKLSARIVKYRHRLGFFHSLEQLKEVYGLKGEYLDKMLPYVYLGKDFSAYPHIRLNDVTIEVLQKHPYFSDWKIARRIINYRKKIEKYDTWQDLYNVSDLDSMTVQKIAPYLIIE